MHGKRDAVQLYRITNHTHSDTEHRSTCLSRTYTHADSEQKKEEKLEESRAVGFPSKLKLKARILWVLTCKIKSKAKTKPSQRWSIIFEIQQW
jgi:hypothetical protein